jgi:hypothetical protein
MTTLPDLNTLIQNGPFIRAQKIVIFGPEAVGKSTLASKFPDPLFVDCEDGSLRIDTRRIRALDSGTFYSVIHTLAKAEQLPCKSLIIDTIDAAEIYVRNRVLRVHQLKTIEGASYGSGWALFRQEFNRLLADFDRFIERGIHVVVISHSVTKKFQAPSSDTAYDRFELDLYQPNSQKLKQWADAVLFLDWDLRVVENRSGKARGVGGKTRVLHTQHCAAFDAKSRVSLPEKLPAEFDALVPLLGPTKEKEVIQQGSADSASTSAQSTASPPPLNPELRDRLLDVIGDMETEAVRAYLVSRKLVPEGGWIDNLSERQVQWIIEHTAKFREQVERFADQPF